MEDRPRKGKLWHRIKHRNTVAPSVDPHSNDNVRHFGVELKRRQRVLFYTNKIVKRRKSEDRSTKIAPLYHIASSDNDIQEYCRNCPSSAMSRFQERDILRKVDARGLELKHPILLNTIMDEAKEEFLKITRHSGIEMKLKIVKQYTVQCYKYLGRTKNYPVFLRRQKEFQQKFILHAPLIRRILAECVTKLPYELFNLNTSLKSQLDVTDFEKHIFDYANDAVQRLQEFYRNIVVLVEHEKVNTLRARSYLGACTGLLSVNISRAIAHTLLHVVSFTGSKEHVPYLKLNIMFKDRLVLEPTADEIIEIYNKFLRKIIDSTKLFHVLEKHRLKGFDDKHLYLCLTEEFFDSVLEKISINIKEKYEPILEFIKSLDDEFKDIYGDLNSDDKIYFSSDLVFEDGCEKLLYFKTYLSKVAFIPDNAYFKLGQLAITDYKTILKENLVNIIENIFNNLSSQHEWENNDICEAFDIIYVRATQKPITTEELIEIGKYLGRVKAEYLDELKERVVKALDYLTKLIQLGSLKENHIILNAKAINWLDKVLPVLEENSIVFEQLKFEAEEKLQRVIEDINVDIKQVYPLLDILNSMDNIARVQDYLNAITLHMVKIKKIEKKVSWINQEEVSLSFPMSSYSEFDELKNYVYPFYHLLKLCLDVRRNLSVWLDGQFDLINYEKVKKIVEKYHKELLTTQKVYRNKLRQAQDENLSLRFKGTVDDPDMLNWPAPLKLCSEAIKLIQDFEPFLTVIKIMCNGALMKRHWEKMSKVAGFDMTPNAGTTLRKISEIDLKNNIDKYELISFSATKESELLEDLRKMQEQWYHVYFTTAQHEEVKVVVHFQDIEAVADNHLIKIVQMLNSIYVKPYLNDVKSFHNNLLKISTTIEEFEQTQHQLLRFRPLFLCDEIKMKIIDEFDIFQQISNIYANYVEMINAEANVYTTVNNTNLLPDLFRCNQQFELINHGVNSYFNEIRRVFPKFYFISNEEIFHVLSLTKKPSEICIKSIFPEITKLQFDDNKHIVGVTSEHNEVLQLSSSVDTKQFGEHVELWLKELDEQVKASIQRMIRESFNSYQEDNWLLNWPGQILLAVTRIVFTTRTQKAINDFILTDYQREVQNSLQNTIQLFKSFQLNLTSSTNLQSLIVLMIKNQETVKDLITNQIDNDQHFKWLSQMRYYLGENDENVIINFFDNCFNYGNEYLGNVKQIVVTPDVEKCYHKLLLAYKYNLCGSLHGATDTGKTSTIRSLAQMFAVHCILFNCSENLESAVFIRLVKGIAASGAWLVLENFNKVSLNICSVLTQELSKLSTALKCLQKTVVVDATEFELKNYFVCCTMQDFSQLDDTFKMAFRPVSMNLPDCKIIAQAILCSVGYQNWNELGRSIAVVHTLMRDLLSTTKNKFEVRSVKEILSKCILLRETNKLEEEIVYDSICDVTISQLTSTEAEVFERILTQIFPTCIRKLPQFVLKNEVLDICKNRNLECSDQLLIKVEELYESINSKTGVIIVGETYTGKTTLIDILQLTLNQNNLIKLNPNLFNLEQIFGRLRENRLEWDDGIVTRRLRECSTTQEWIVFDGPFNSLWIEHLNTTLDDNPKLCLSSGEAIFLNKNTRIIFETDSIDNASPSMVSRCSIVYLEPKTLGWKPLLHSWLHLGDFEWKEGHEEILTVLFDWVIPPCSDYIKNHCQMLCEVNEISLVKTTIKVFEMILAEAYGAILRKEEDPKNLSSWIQATFIQAVVWGLGSNLNLDSRHKFDEFFKQLWRGHNEFHPYPKSLEKIEVNVPSEENIFDYTYLFKSKGNWKYWPDALKNEKIEESDYLTHIFVPTNETMKFAWMINMHLNHNYPALLVGPSGTGKTFSMLDTLINKLNKDVYEPTFITFTANMNSNQVQKMLLSKLFRKISGRYGPSDGKIGIFYIDDFNEPSRNKSINQGVLELMREMLSHRQLFGAQNFQPINIDSVNIFASMTFSFDNRNQYQRLLRHFNVFSVNQLKDESINRIFSQVLLTKWKKVGFPSDIVGTVNQIVTSTFHFYTNILTIKPNICWNFSYFNMGNFRKIIQTCSMIKKESADANKKLFLKLWSYEMFRVLGDRLLEKDQEWFIINLKLCIADYFKEDYESLFESLRGDSDTEPDFDKLLFSTINDKTTDRFDEIDFEKFEEMFVAYIKNHNQENENKIDLILFEYALEYLSKVCRIISLTGCNLLQVGMCGTGRQSLVKLACMVYNQQFFHLQMKEHFNLNDWHQIVKLFLKEAGGLGKHCTFFLKEEQIVDDSVLNDVDYLMKTGQIPFLYTLEEEQAILEVVRTNLQEQEVKIDYDSESVFLYYRKRCQENLHIIFSFNFKSQKFRKYLRMYPSLRKYCEVVLLKNWPKESQEHIARVWMVELNLTDDLKTVIVTASSHFYNEVKHFSKSHVPMGSYLHFLRFYIDQIKLKQNKIKSIKQKYLSALEKLSFAAVQILEMQKSLADYQPQLEAMTVQAIEMAKQIETETIEVEKASDLVKKDEETANEQAAAAQILKLDCEADLAQAIPILEDAISALNTLKPTDITLVKSMKNPPDAIKLVMAAVCVIKDVKPDRIPDPSTGRKTIDYWGPSKRILGDMNFLQTLKDFDKDNIRADIMVKVRKDYLPHKDFKPHIVAKASSAAEGLCKWIIAMDMYDKVAKEVAPKKEKLEKAEREYGATIAILNEKKEQVARIEQKLADLNTMLKEATRKQQRLQRDVDICKGKLNRAQKLIGGLSEEKNRWTRAVDQLEKQYSCLPGDILHSSAIVSYMGALRCKDRCCLSTFLLEYMTKNNIPFRESCSLTEIFEKEIDLDDWHLNGLPRDTFLVENAIIGKLSKRWSLFIDPQNQANAWIKIMKKPNGLRVTKLTNQNYLKLLKECITNGAPLLIENVGKTIKPFLTNLITRTTFFQNKIEFINIDGEIISYHKNFLLYMTTNIKNPDYGFEIYGKINVIDFTMTEKSVEENLLTCVTEVEKPAMKKIKENLYTGRKQYKDSLNSIEEKILKILSESTTDILEDESALQVLDDSKVLSKRIQEKQESLMETEIILNKIRSDYGVVAKRSVVLYFTIFCLSKINHMYQFSYDWFIETYCESIRKAARFKKLPQRVESLIDTITYELYTKISRSIFEKDKLFFSFLLCTNLSLAAEKITSEEIEQFARFCKEMKENKLASKKHWDDILFEMNTYLSNFSQEVIKNESKFHNIFESRSPELETFPEPFDQNLLKLIVIGLFRPDRFFKAIRNFVKSEMGDKFIKVPVFDIVTSFADSHILSPLIILKKPESDPISTIINFAKIKHFQNKLIITSIAKGEEHIFETLLEKSKQLGLWICLQNAHLVPNSLTYVDSKLEEVDYSNTQENFRLWLTTNESNNFPLSLLEKSIKIVNEPPHGIRNKLIDLVSNHPISSPEFYDNCPGKQDTFVSLLYGTILLHSLLQERQNFHFYGWNALYIFNAADIFIALYEVQAIVNNRCQPLEEITYVLSNCVYGGHTSHSSDIELIKILVKNSLQPKTKNLNVFSNIPTVRTDYHNFINHIQYLPDTNCCEIFGLHINYDEVADLNESKSILRSIRTIFDTNLEEIEVDVLTIIQELLSKLPELEMEDKRQKSDDFIVDLILSREVEHYRNLFDTIKGSLENLKVSINSSSVLSDQNEQLRNSLVMNLIPKFWNKNCLKNFNSVSSYIENLSGKYDYLMKFVYNSSQEIWLGSFLRPKSFLIGTKLIYSKKHGVPCDEISFHLQKRTNFTNTDTGIIITGLYLSGAHWNNERGIIEELLPNILNDKLPTVLFAFTTNDTNQSYECPLYKGMNYFLDHSVLKNSSNFISNVLIDSGDCRDHWITRKVSLLCEI